jgi:hypothetical protein
MKLISLILVLVELLNFQGPEKYLKEKGDEILSIILYFEKIGSEVKVEIQDINIISGEYGVLPSEGEIKFYFKDKEGNIVFSGGFEEPKEPSEYFDRDGRIHRIPNPREKGFIWLRIQYDKRMRFFGIEGFEEVNIEGLLLQRETLPMAIKPIKLENQQWEVKKIIDHGPSDKRFDFVFLAEGYTKEEIDNFEKDVLDVVENGLYNPLTFFGFYKELTNVTIIKAVSEERGAGENGKPKNTAFKSFFGCGGIDRLLCVDTGLVLNTVNKLSPWADTIFVLVNSNKYGGAGYGSLPIGIATFSKHEFGRLVAIHELGHSFARVADEYDAAWPMKPEKEPQVPNITLANNREELKKVGKWFYFSEPFAGLYPTGFNGEVNRAEEICAMRNLMLQFGVVCFQAHLLRLKQYVDKIEPIELPSNNLAIRNKNLDLTFFVFPLFYVIEVDSIKWFVNDNVVENDLAHLTLNIEEETTVKIEIKDKGGKTFTKEWQIKTSCESN